METDDRLIYLMARTGHRLKEYIRARMLEDDIKISQTQGGILFLLDERGALSMSDISNAFDVDNSAITGMVDRLERAGYVVRKPHVSDRRVNLVSITEAGRSEAARSKGVVKEVNAKIKEGFSAEEIEVFKRVLSSFYDKFPPNRERSVGGRSRKGGARS